MALVANFISYNSSARIQEHQRRMKETFSVCDYSTICRWWQWGSPRCLIYISLSCAVERQTELIYRAHVWQGSIGGAIRISWTFSGKEATRLRRPHPVESPRADPCCAGHADHPGYAGDAQGFC